MVGKLKQNWIFIVIVGLCVLLLLDINTSIIATIASLILIDFSYDCNSKAINENVNRSNSFKYYGYITLKIALVLAALFLFKYFT